MSDYKDKLDEWQRAARRKAQELDEKYGIKERVEEGARAAQDAARKGKETVADGAERVRREAERLDEQYEVSEHARRVAGAATAKAGEVFGDAKHYYGRASDFYKTGAHFTRASAYTSSAFLKAGSWARENPGKAALVTFSLITGVRLGASFPGIDAVLLGSHPHWITHSALPVYGLRKASEKFDSYLKRQEELVSSGDLTKAEEERVEFERKIVKYVGAPLLGAFSCAAGAVMWAQIAQPGRITGAPISWLLGGNPFLDGVWLFANGVLCFHQGYKFFMIALADQEDVARVVREIKGLLPAGEAA